MTLSSVFAWFAPALLVFWAVGAYNRLVRLRSVALQAFGALDAAYAQQTALLLDEPSDAVGAPASDRPTWVSLQAAARQFDASLAAARSQPLQRDSLAALCAARDVLADAWQAGAADAAGSTDVAGATRLPALVALWEGAALQQQQALARFNAAAHAYSRAVGQFPAVLLAWLFGFKPARTL